MAKTVAFNKLNKLNVSKRMEAVRSPGIGSQLLSMLTPTEFAELFPKYYQKGLPDTGGFQLAISRKSQTQQQQYFDSIDAKLGTNNPLSRERTERQGTTPSGASGGAGTTPYKGGRYTAAQAAALIRKVGGSPEEAAALGAVAMPESQGDPRAHNPNRNTGDDSWGLWQINMLDKLAADRYKRFGKFGLTKPSDLENPELNAKIALQMYRDKIAAGRPGLEDWSTWKSGKDVAYRQQAAAGANGNVELPQAAGATPSVSGTTGTSQYTAEVQKNRPQVRQGSITFEGTGSKFAYGSGSPSDPNYPSIPSGSSKLTGLNPHNVPGGVGIDMPALQGYDPKVNRSRDGMVIHMGRSNDPTELYSHGCIAIPPNQFNAFNKQLDEFKRSHGGEAYINVFPDGNITVTAAPQMTGEIVTATEAVQKQRQALEEGKKVPYQTPIGEELQQQSQAHQSGSLGAGGTGKVNVDQLTNQQLKNAGVETPSLTISQKPAEQKTQSVEPTSMTIPYDQSKLISQLAKKDKRAGEYPEFLVMNGFADEVKGYATVDQNSKTITIKNMNDPKVKEFLKDVDINSIKPDQQASLGEKVQRELGVASAQAGDFYGSAAEAELLRRRQAAMQQPTQDKYDAIMAAIRRQESGKFEGDYSIKAKGRSTASGAYQFNNKTWGAVTKQFGIGTEYKRAMDAPKDVQDAVMKARLEWMDQRGYSDQEKFLTHFTGNRYGRSSSAGKGGNPTASEYASSMQKHLDEFHAQQQTQVAATQTTSAPGPTPAAPAEPRSIGETVKRVAQETIGVKPASAAETPKPTATVTPPPAQNIPQAGKPDESSSQNFLKSQGIGVKTAADGGAFTVPDGGIEAYPIGGLKGDNTIVTNKEQQPLFTMNSNETAMYDPSQNRVDVIPQSKADNMGPAPNPFMSALEGIRAEMQQTFNQIGQNTPEAPVQRLPQDRADDNPSMIKDLNNLTAKSFQSPSFYRAMTRTRGQETGDGTNDHHFSYGNKS